MPQKARSQALAQSTMITSLLLCWGALWYAVLPATGCRSTRLEPPKDLVLVIAVPWLEVPKKKTEVARSVLPKVALKDVVHNISGAATIVAGFALKDVETITKGIDDAIIEPARKHLIPGYDSVKQNAISAGALQSQ